MEAVPAADARVDLCLFLVVEARVKVAAVAAVVLALVHMETISS